MTAEIVTVEVLGSAMEVFCYEPQVAAPWPGIVLAQHVPIGHTGLENDLFTLKTAERLADNGYAVAVPFIFHWWPKDEDLLVKRDASRDDWMVADCRAAFEWLANNPNVAEDRLSPFLPGGLDILDRPPGIGDLGVIKLPQISAPQPVPCTAWRRFAFCRNSARLCQR